MGDFSPRPSQVYSTQRMFTRLDTNTGLNARHSSTAITDGTCIGRLSWKVRPPATATSRLGFRICAAELRPERAVIAEIKKASPSKVV